MDTELGRNSFEVNTRMELPQTGRGCYGGFKMWRKTVRSERRCALKTTTRRFGCQYGSCR
jgi:hypothetical protein